LVYLSTASVATTGSLAPVFLELGRGVELDGVDADHFEFGAAGGTVDDLSDFEVLVQGDFGPTLDAFWHCTRNSISDPLKAFELIRIE